MRTGSLLMVQCIGAYNAALAPASRWSQALLLCGWHALIRKQSRLGWSRAALCAEPPLFTAWQSRSHVSSGTRMVHAQTIWTCVWGSHACCNLQLQRATHAPGSPEGSPAWTLSCREVAQRPVAQGGATLHFVDDRYETMQAIAEQAPDLLGRWVPAGVPPAEAAPACPCGVATGVCSLASSGAAAWTRLCGRLPACARTSHHICTQKLGSLLLSFSLQLQAVAGRLGVQYSGGARGGGSAAGRAPAQPAAVLRAAQVGRGHGGARAAAVLACGLRWPQAPSAPASSLPACLPLPLGL